MADAELTTSLGEAAAGPLAGSGRVLLTGSHGMIGTALQRRWRSEGREVVCLVRSEPAGQAEPAGRIRWNPRAGELDPGRLEGFDAVVHLAGEPVGRRWTAARKERILASRTEGTRLLAEALAGLERRPRVLLCASGVGIYGDRGDEELTEDSAPGEGFLAEVCRQWESASAAAAEAGIRTVRARLAVVLSTEGGALVKMLGPFRKGLGGRIGSGRQYWSWIALDDVVGGIEHMLATESLAGPVNLAAPRAVTNREFTKALGRALRRWTFLPLPGWAARLMLGQMAREMLLASARVVPAKLLASGFEYQYERLEEALAGLLG